MPLHVPSWQRLDDRVGRGVRDGAGAVAHRDVKVAFDAPVLCAITNTLR